MGSTARSSGENEHVAECLDCDDFHATGTEAYVMRKGSLHSKDGEHRVRYDDA